MHFNLDGIIFVVGGIYGVLVAWGIVQASKNPDANEIWRKKYGTVLKILSPLIILFGLVELSGLFK